MREMRQVAVISREAEDWILGVCQDDTLWLGRIKTSDEGLEAVEWQPLNSPPDGEFWHRRKDWWDKIEEDLRRQAREREDHSETAREDREGRID